MAEWTIRSRTASRMQRCLSPWSSEEPGNNAYSTGATERIWRALWESPSVFGNHTRGDPEYGAQEKGKKVDSKRSVFAVEVMERSLVRGSLEAMRAPRGSHQTPMLEVTRAVILNTVHKRRQRGPARSKVYPWWK